MFTRLQQFRALTGAGLALLTLGGTLLCAEVKGVEVKGAEEKAKESPPTVAALIKQLDADEFGRREEASRRLMELGAAAVPELSLAAQQQNLEVRSRAFAILKDFDSGENAQLQHTARLALKEIAAKREAAEKNKDDALASAAVTAKAILGKPFLGLMGNGGNDATVGAVVEGSPAEKAGVKIGDIVTSFSGTPTQSFANLIAAVSTTEPGDRVKLEVNRDGETMKIDLTVGRYPTQPVLLEPPIIQFIPQDDLFEAPEEP